MAQQAKDLALSLLWLGMLASCRCGQKKKKKKNVIVSLATKARGVDIIKDMKLLTPL